MSLPYESVTKLFLFAIPQRYYIGGHSCYIRSTQQCDGQYTYAEHTRCKLNYHRTKCHNLDKRVMKSIVSRAGLISISADYALSMVVNCVVQRTSPISYNYTGISRIPYKICNEVFRSFCYSIHYIQHTYCTNVRSHITHAPHNVHIHLFVCSISIASIMFHPMS